MSGRVIHFELPADDVERARTFYREAFGWRMQEWSGGEEPYTMVTTTETDDSGLPTRPGGINGGMMRRAEPFTAPIVTIEVDDIDAALNNVEKLGGKIAVGRQPVGDMGFAGYFVDPEGNVIGLWENARPS